MKYIIKSGKKKESKNEWRPAPIVPIDKRGEKEIPTNSWGIKAVMQALWPNQQAKYVVKIAEKVVKC